MPGTSGPIVNSTGLEVPILRNGHTVHFIPLFVSTVAARYNLLNFILAYTIFKRILVM